MENKHKRYEIDTFEKLINVANIENVERLTIDLLSWLVYVVNIIEKFKKDHPELCEGKTNWQLVECIFVWVDDGKNDLKNIELRNKETGEITNINLNNQ